jgi:hypothetical protein
VLAQVLATNPFTFEQWSWIAGIFSATLPVLVWLIRLVQTHFQSDLQAMEHAFHGVRIGASAKSLQKLKIKQIDRSGSGAIKMTKWALPNGNDLSVTYNSVTDRIVYMEVDWCKKQSALSTGLAKKQFGITSLSDIRKAFKSNGFTYVNRVFHKTPEELVCFNAFELQNTPNIIAVFITSISQEEQNNIRAVQSDEEKLDRVGDSFKLDAIALGDEAYLDEIWGTEKIYDPTSHPIKLPVTSKVATLFARLTGGSKP